MTSMQLTIPELLSGMELASVEFVRDYLQLHFDGPSLTSLTFPDIEVRARRLQYGDSGYRDTLCTFIGRKVLEANVLVDIALWLAFEDDGRLVFSLKPSEAVGPEMVVFRLEDGSAYPL